MPPKQNSVQRPPGQGKSRSARRRRAKRQAASQGHVPVRKRDVTQGPLRPINSGKEADFCRAYANVLDDPFHHEPVRLGFGTLVETQLSAARVTTTFTGNSSDGSLTIIVKPNAHTPISGAGPGFTTNPVTGSSWVSVSDSAWTAATAQYDSARPIALGVRIVPISAATDKICQAVTGQINYDATNNSALLASLNAYTTQDWFTSHLGTKVNFGAGNLAPLEMTWRPMSLKNFEFNTDWLDDNPDASTTAVFPTQGPALFVAISGPNSMKYDIDVIYYYEAVANLGALSSGASPGTEKASSYFPSLETFYNKVTSLLTDDNVGHLADMATAAVPVLMKQMRQRSIPYYPGLQMTRVSNDPQGIIRDPRQLPTRRNSVDEKNFGQDPNRGFRGLGR